MHQYKAYRKRPDGSIHDVVIEILDAGPGDSTRWHVVATDDEGRHATGNPESRLDLALSVVHWYDLDRDG